MSTTDVGDVHDNVGDIHDDVGDSHDDMGGVHDDAGNGDDAVGGGCEIVVDWDDAAGRRLIDKVTANGGGAGREDDVTVVPAPAGNGS
jgi:hypothetical protein